jgi:hypothetical protein
MIKTLAVSLLATLSLLFAAAPRETPPPATETWTEAAKLELSYKAPDPKKDPNAGAEGAPGATGASFFVGKFHGGAVVDRIEGKGVGVFVGIASTAKLEDAIAKGIRVRFTDKSKKTHDVKHDAIASGATAMLFLSPSALAPHEIASVHVMFDSSASWAR